MTVDMTVTGIEELQDANLRKIAALKPRGPFGRMVKFIGTALHRYSVSITHVDTGTLKASERLDLDLDLGRATIFLDPTAVNPRSGDRASEYGVDEHARGGTHAFFARTLRERGKRTVRAGLRIFTRELLK